ncbi:MAG: DUF5752 family protein [Promethearchaeota archaeon]
MSIAELYNIARRSIGNHVDPAYAFEFKHPDTKEIIAIAHNLTELLVYLEQEDYDLIKHHYYRITNRHLDGTSNGEQQRSDIALWIQYILGDDLLATKIWELRNSNFTKLHSDLIQVIKERHEELQRILQTGNA